MFAKDKVRLAGGHTSIELSGADITLTMPGLLDVKGVTRSFVGPAGNPAELSVLPTGQMEARNWIAIEHHDLEGGPFVGQGYKIFFEGGQVISGKLNEHGQACHDDVPRKAERVEYEFPEPLEDVPWDPIGKLVAATRSKLG